MRNIYFGNKMYKMPNRSIISNNASWSRDTFITRFLGQKIDYYKKGSNQRKSDDNKWKKKSKTSKTILSAQKEMKK